MPTRTLTLDQATDDRLKAAVERIKPTPKGTSRDDWVDQYIYDQVVDRIIHRAEKDARVVTAKAPESGVPISDGGLAVSHR